MAIGIYNLPLPPPPYPFPPFFPSLISLRVSMDVKYHMFTYAIAELRSCVKVDVVSLLQGVGVNPISLRVSGKLCDSLS